MLIDISLAEKLITRLIELVKRHEEQDKDLYTNFVVPAFADFEAVHKDYLESFRKYRDTLKNSEEFLTPNHSLFDELQEDMLFSESLRAKLAALVPMQEHKALGGFIFEILSYLSYSTIAPCHQYSKDDAIICMQRITLRDELRKIAESRGSNDKKIEDSLRELDLHLSVIQRQYGLIVYAMFILKQQLLNPVGKKQRANTTKTST